MSRRARLPSPAGPGDAARSFPSARAEAALVQVLLSNDERTADHLLDALGCLLLVTDVDGQFIRWNAAAERLTRQLLGDPVADGLDAVERMRRLVPPEEVDDVQRIFMDLRSGRIDRVTNVNHWRGHRGQLLFAWLNTRLSLGGRDVVVSVGVEVRGEAVLRSAHRIAQERFRLLADAMPDVVVYQYALPESSAEPAVRRGRIEYVSDAVTHLTGYRPADYYADPGLGEELLGPDALAALAARTGDLLGPGPPQLLRWVRPDGAVVWAEHRAVQIRDAAGALVALQGVVTDVTDRVLGERIAEAQARILETVAEGRRLAESRDAALTAVETELPGTLALLLERACAEPSLRVVAAPSAPELLGTRADAELSGALVGVLTADVDGALGPLRPGGDLRLADLPALPPAWAAAAVRRGVRHVACVPVELTGDERRTYLLVLAAHPPAGDRGGRVLATFARLLAIADERDRARRVLQHRATHDDLTGLVNRAELLRRLEAGLADAPGRGRLVALFFCDLDRFKNINDSLGHSAGDALLVAVAERLREAAGPGDVVARTGGDEFTVIHETAIDGTAIHGIGQDPRAAVAAAARLVAAMEAPFRVLGRRVYTSLSVGVAVAGPGTPCAGATAEALIRDADAAMYRAKARGGHRVEVFDTIMRVQADRRLELETALHGALVRRELRVEYQPQVQLHTGRVIGAEALLRWQHGGRDIPPAEFVPVAEETGLIVPIGAWALETACVVAVEQARVMGPGFRMGVNLSARQLGDPNLLEQVSRALTRSGLPPRQLCLEVTETTLMDDAPAAMTALRALHELGVTFAIDDFGTGYSSLLYLKRLPVSALKIDTTFVRGLGHDADDEAIVASTIQLGHALGRRVIGEGVETQAQQAHLQALGCRYAQGYRFGRPGAAHLLPTAPQP